MGFMTLSYRN